MSQLRDRILRVFKSACHGMCLDNAEEREAVADALVYELEGKHNYLVIIHDVDGFGRAWAVAPTMEAATAAAEHQWTSRVEQRRAEGTIDRSEERGEVTLSLVPKGG